jgi:hypothetical protein
MTGNVKEDWRNAGNEDLIYCSLQLTIEQTCIFLMLVFTSCAQETLAVFFPLQWLKLGLFLLLITQFGALFIQTLSRDWRM